MFPGENMAGGHDAQAVQLMQGDRRQGRGRAPWSMEAAALEPSPIAIAIWES